MPAIRFLDHYVAQSWSALTMITKVLSKNHSIKRVVELGTGSGALTMLFGLNMIVRNGRVLSFDIHNPSPKLKLLFPIYNINFEQMDVFEDDTIEMVKNFSRDHPTLFFCDNGNKKEEFRVYSKLMKENDLIMIHDWKTEFTQEDLDAGSIPPLKPYFQEEFDNENTLILCMRRSK